MRQRTIKLVITFPTTTAAMAMESACMTEGIPGRLIPVPREITADCGMAWCAPVESRTQLEAFIGSRDIFASEFYELLI